MKKLLRYRLAVLWLALSLMVSAGLVASPSFAFVAPSPAHLAINRHARRAERLERARDLKLAGVANNDPIWAKTPAMTFGAVITTANTAKDGTGTVVLIATAGANGAKFRKVVAETVGTNVASVLRLFRNNGASNTTATNNTLSRQITLPATTLTEVAGQAPVEHVLNWELVAGERVYATIGTTVAAGWALRGDQGDY